MDQNEDQSPSKPQHDLTKLLLCVRANDERANQELFSLVYNELHAIAERFMCNERLDHTLQTTALVHEAYIRLGGEKDTAWESQAEFFKLAARAMRRVLIDYARRKRADKREGKLARKSLEDVTVAIENTSSKLLDLEGALHSLSALDPQLAQIVELRFFCGLTVEDTAKVLSISPGTVYREWALARAWLSKYISEKENDTT